MYTINDLKEIDLSKVKASKLSGTEKQIAWAKKIRIAAYHDLIAYTLNRTSDGKPSGLYTVAMKGLDAMVGEVEARVEAISNDALTAEIIDRAVASYIDLGKRMARLREIMAHDDAGWWIDHRPESINNYLYQEFHSYLDAE